MRIEELGRSAEFGAFAAAQEARALQLQGAAGPGGGPSGAPGADAPAASSTASTYAPPTYASPTYASLTYAFSELGFAQMLLGMDKPGDALAALSELRCSDCRAAGGGPGAAAVCEPQCARFDELNPGYAGLPDKHRRLSLDARGLALEARLSMGRAELIARPPRFAAAAAYWRRALVHGRELERYRETTTSSTWRSARPARPTARDGSASRCPPWRRRVR